MARAVVVAAERVRAALIFLGLLIVACGEQQPELSLRDARVAAGAARLAGTQSCVRCHAEIVASFAEHGMSQSLGPLDHRPEGALGEPGDAHRYVFGGEADRVLATWQRADGGQRVQGVVGRYGAGIFDTSYIGTELKPDGSATGRLSFLPMEMIVGHGLAAAPFEALHAGTGFDVPLNSECLRCHTTQDPSELPGAATDADSGTVWPGAQLGADAFEHLEPLSCSACHGATEEHAQLMQRSLDSSEPYAELGLTRLAELPGARQRDLCARCHLQGEGHLELSELPRGGPQPEDFLLRRPVLVPTEPGDDFRFVSQVQRLALSACLQSAPELSCSSCHDPHRAVASQGVADFDARCLGCHEPRACVRPPSLSVLEASGRPARTETGCVDCHLRRSQPFDLPHVTTTDHYVRRTITPSETPPLRAWEDPTGPLEVFDDGRFAELLSTGAGQRWNAGLQAMALQRMGRPDEAKAKFAALEPVLSDQPDETTPQLPDLKGSAEFHFVRGLLLQSLGEEAAARSAYSAALDRDPAHPGARLNRGGLRVAANDLGGALDDAAELIHRYPRAEKPWNLRARAAAAANDLDAAAAALARSAELWPSDPVIWHELGVLFRRLRQDDAARAAFQRASALEPSRPGLRTDRDSLR